MSIELNKLRIGNFVFDDENEVMKIARIETKEYTDWNNGDEFSITIEKGSHNNNYYQSIINGIPITEEWLLKFGFEKLTEKSKRFTSNTYTYGKGFSFIVHFNDNLLSVNFWQGNEKKYVHELQNFFFALTGVELWCS
jgi:hypothetical protein